MNQDKLESKINNMDQLRLIKLVLYIRKRFRDEKYPTWSMELWCDLLNCDRVYWINKDIQDSLDQGFSHSEFFYNGKIREIDLKNLKLEEIEL